VKAARPAWRRRGLRLLLTVATMTAGASSVLAPAPAAAASGLRLAGTFTMHGTITVAGGVNGESVGQRVRRMWTFVPGCPAGACATITLRRRRSPRHVADTVLLRRRARGVYAGTHHFWIPALCAGRVVSHGGLATETITVTVTAAITTETGQLATAVNASYVNPQRLNFTRCPGSLGQDAAYYTGRLVTHAPTPAPPPAPATPTARGSASPPTGA
jgi:hypothetical protein